MRIQTGSLKMKFRVKQTGEYCHATLRNEFVNGENVLRSTIYRWKGSGNDPLEFD